MTSVILSKLAEIYPEVLTEPQKILGPNAPKVLEFWRHIDGLSADEKMNDRYRALNCNVRVSAKIAAMDAARDVVGEEFRCGAFDAAYDVTGRWVFGYATCELIGDVKNKVAYDLIMSHKNS
jgi:hypothetical protein